jgi:PIN domain nuclease of toxin-antitoxin system
VTLLLDTHAWLWFVLANQQLSTTARSAIENPANECFVSMASVWELGIKLSLGKYQLTTPFDEFLDRAIDGQGFQRLDIAPAHVVRVAQLPFHHRDPFDRILISQAIEESAMLITHDHHAAAYGITTLW